MWKCPGSSPLFPSLMDSATIKAYRACGTMIAVLLINRSAPISKSGERSATLCGAKLFHNAEHLKLGSATDMRVK